MSTRRLASSNKKQSSNSSKRPLRADAISSMLSFNMTITSLTHDTTTHERLDNKNKSVVERSVY